MHAAKVLSQLNKFEKILLIAHENPDGDTLAASVTLYRVLKSLQKDVRIVCKDPVPKPFRFLIHSEDIKQDLLFGDFELIVTIDCGDVRRTGFDERLKTFIKNKKYLINIDHHPKNDLHKLAHLNYISYEASSTCEIVYEFLNENHQTIDREIATAIYTGLYTDTGGFKHSNTNEKTLKIAGELLKFGARQRLITKNVSLNRSVSALKLWGIALLRLRKHPYLKIVSSVLTHKDIEACNATEDDVAGVVNLINTTEQSKAAILFYETGDNLIRASLRTEDDKTDISKLAAIFGGGGHKKASGFTVNGKFCFGEDENDWRIVL